MLDNILYVVGNSDIPLKLLGHFYYLLYN